MVDGRGLLKKKKGRGDEIPRGNGEIWKKGEPMWLKRPSLTKFVKGGGTNILLRRRAEGKNHELQGQ